MGLRGRRDGRGLMPVVEPIAGAIRAGATLGFNGGFVVMMALGNALG